MPEVGILIIDNDVSTQRALKSILDAEGWRVRIVSAVAPALAELASGNWNLAIANTAVADVHGPLFAILKELTQAEYAAPEGTDESLSGEADPALAPAVPETRKPQLRALFLVPPLGASNVQPVLEREGLPYSLKPYHLQDFLERVSELLMESGAIFEPIRTVADFSGTRRFRTRRTAPASRPGAMFAARDDYQMTEEEMADWERQEEEDRKRREKAMKTREHLG